MANGDTEGRGGNPEGDEVRLHAQSTENQDSNDSRRYNRLAQAIGERVRELRVAQRRSRARLARAANLAESHLGEIERGETAPSSSTLAKLAVALDVEVNSIFPPMSELPSMVGLEGQKDGSQRKREEQTAEYAEYRREKDDELWSREQLVQADATHMVVGEGGQVQRGAHGRAVNILLSPSVIARMAHVEVRTLQKWIASGLVEPSFYIMQEHRQRSPEEGNLAEKSRNQQPSRSAAFKPEDLPRIIAVRNRARVRQSGQARQSRNIAQPENLNSE